MFETMNTRAIWDSFASWFDAQFWIAATLHQVVIIAACFIIGGLLFRAVKGRIETAISKSELPIRAKRNLDNLSGLVFPVAALTMMFFATLIATDENVQIGTSYIIGTMKVISAWVVIRIAVEVIDNSAIRSIFAIGIWVIAALSLLGILDETSTALDAIGFSIGDFRLSALAVIKGILAIFVLLYAAIFLSTFLERRVLKSRSLTRSSQVLVSKIIRITLLVFAVLIGVTSAGIDLSIFAVFSGAVGLGVGFGLQKVVSNLFSGLLLLMDKSIEPGDVIELESSQTFGWVNHMGARFTEIITRDNKSYLIPNEEFITQNVVNWSHGNRLNRLEVKFGVHYDSDPHQVIAIAKQAALRPDRVVKSPEPVCWMTEFGDSSLNFSLRFWIKDAESGVTNIKGAVLLALWDAFKENGVKIPYPHREVFVHEVK